MALRVWYGMVWYGATRNRRCNNGLVWTYPALTMGIWWEFTELKIVLVVRLCVAHVPLVSRCVPSLGVALLRCFLGLVWLCFAYLPLAQFPMHFPLLGIVAFLRCFLALAPNCLYFPCCASRACPLRHALNFDLPCYTLLWQHKPQFPSQHLASRHS